MDSRPVVGQQVWKVLGQSFVFGPFIVVRVNRSWVSLSDEIGHPQSVDGRTHNINGWFNIFASKQAAIERAINNVINEKARLDRCELELRKQLAEITKSQEAA